MNPCEWSRAFYLLPVMIFIVHTALRGQIPLRSVDLSRDAGRQVVVDQEPGQYLGHPTTVLLRENRRVHRSFVMRSDDEGKSWTPPTELPPSLTGDRHTAKYAPDGRLLVSFRDMFAFSPTYGDWVAWVGTFDDIVMGREGEYRIRLMDNLGGTDCGYPGVEVLPDGTFVLTSYGHWIEGEEPFIISVRLKLSEIDR